MGSKNYRLFLLAYIGRRLLLPVATAYRWTSQGNLPDTHGGNRFILVVEEHKEFMVDLIEHTRTVFGEPVVMVIDNAPCHSNLQSVFREPEFFSRQNVLLRVAPNSPMYNPMENVWSLAKAKVKRSLAEKWQDILRNTPQGLSVKEHRLRAFEELIKEGMRRITQGICSNLVSHIFQ